MKQISSWLKSFLFLAPVQYVGYALSLGVLACFFGIHDTVTNDTWWHLATGKEIWEGTFSFSDYHSWTAAGSFWPAHELGYEWLLYGLWCLAGGSFILAGVLNIVLVLCSFLLVIPPKRIREKFSLTSNFLVPVLIFSAGVTLVFFVQIRAQAVSFFLFVLTVRLILSKKPYWIPLIFLLWVWLHGSVFIGVAVMGVVCIVMIIKWLCEIKNNRKMFDAIHYSVAGVLSLVATCLSPLGFKLWVYFTKVVSYGKTTIQEWQPIFSRPDFVVFTLIAIVLLVVSFIVLFKFIKSWEIIFSYTLVVIFLAYSVSSIRGYANFAFVALMILVIAAMRIRKPEKETKIPSVMNKIVFVFSSLILVFFLVLSVMVSSRILSAGNHNPFVSGGVEKAMRSEKCEGHLWNDYDTGSYMIWFTPDIPVSVDSRFDLYPKWVTDAAGVTVPSGRETDPTSLINNVFDEYDIHCFVLNKGQDSETLKKRGVPVLAENYEMIIFDVSEGIPQKPKM